MIQFCKLVASVWATWWALQKLSPPPKRNSDFGGDPSSPADKVGKPFMFDLNWSLRAEQSKSFLGVDDPVFGKTYTHTLWSSDEKYVGESGWSKSFNVVLAVVIHNFCWMGDPVSSSFVWIWSLHLATSGSRTSGDKTPSFRDSDN